MDILHLIALILHVLGAAFIIGMTFCVLLMFRAKPMSKELMAWSMRFGQMIGGILLLQFVTGIYLYSVEADTLSRPLVGTKFILFVLAGALVGGALRTHKKQTLADKDPSDELVVMWRRNTAIRFLIFLVIAVLGVIVAELAA